MTHEEFSSLYEMLSVRHPEEGFQYDGGILNLPIYMNSFFKKPEVSDGQFKKDVSALLA